MFGPLQRTSRARIGKSGLARGADDEPSRGRRTQSAMFFTAMAVNTTRTPSPVEWSSCKRCWDAGISARSLRLKRSVGERRRVQASPR